MPRRTVITTMILAACIFLPGMATAQPMFMSSGGVPYVSGGVGTDEREAMKAMAGQYNLRLEFAATGGEYLGDIRVILKGPVSLDAVSQGPWFLVSVPPGEYSVTVESAGQAKTRNVSVGGGGQKTVVFRW